MYLLKDVSTSGYALSRELPTCGAVVPQLSERLRMQNPKSFEIPRPQAAAKAPPPLTLVEEQLRLQPC
jgi:hypothetical protein